MVNNFKAVKTQLEGQKRQLHEMEAEVNSVPIKTQNAKQALFMILKNIENIEQKYVSIKFWVDQAEKHELTQ
jgi:archaellum component FlaC